MTDKEKAKAYDEALKKASAAHKDEDRHLKATLEKIFPELNEDKDEKIKNAILNHLKMMWGNCQDDVCGVHVEDAIAWLEKQGEHNLPSTNEREWLYLVSDVLTWKDGIGQYLDDTRVQELAKRLCSEHAQKLYNHSNSSNTGKNEQKSVDKIEPRFKVGDWIASNFSNSSNLLCIIGVDETNYEVVTPQGSTGVPSIRYIDKHFHLWTMQDAKDGDVICYEDEISLYKNEIKNDNKQDTTFGGFTYYCCYDGKNFITDSFYSLIGEDEIDIYPATKEQRDTLMKAMNNAGYEWDAENKELKKED